MSSSYDSFPITGRVSAGRSLQLDHWQSVGKRSYVLLAPVLGHSGCSEQFPSHLFTLKTLRFLSGKEPVS